MKRYVWLHLNTGRFSDSWDEEFHQKHFIELDDKTRNLLLDDPE